MRRAAVVLPVPGNPTVRNKVGRSMRPYIASNLDQLVKAIDDRRRIPGKRKRCLLVYVRRGSVRARLGCLPERWPNHGVVTRAVRSAAVRHQDSSGEPIWLWVETPASVSSVADETSPWELRLYTERLCLRVPASQDAEDLYDLFADAEVMRGLGKEPVSAVEEVRAMIEEIVGGWRTDGLGPFILETAATDRQVVGQAGLMIFDTRDWTPSTWAKAGSHAQPELGWALTRAHWGHGYATEAAAAIRDWAHERPNIDRLVSLISPDNVRSQRVAERLGAIPTETVTPAHSKRTTVVWTHPPIV